MRAILLGQNANGERINLTPEMRRETHIHVIGGSNTGKSKFLEHLIRQDILAGHGVCVLDPHGSLYANLLNWLAGHEIGLDGDYREVFLVDPSRDHYIQPLNFFSKADGDVSVQSSRRVTLTAKLWGQPNTDETPTLERLLGLVYSFAIERQESLVNAAHLLDFNRPDLRNRAMATTTDRRLRSQWASLLETRNLRDWNGLVLSSENRLNRFLTPTISRFMGHVEGCLNIQAVMNRGAIVLVNLGNSSCLAPDQARLFGGFLLNQFFEAAMRRAHALKAGERAASYTLFVDEFQNFLTDDLAAMLDEVRKSGLRMVLSHQHLGHFADNPRLQKSVFTNARIRAVFGGLEYDDACVVAREMFLPDLNQRQIKKAIWHTTHIYQEETRTIRSTSGGVGRGVGRGRGESWASGSGTSSGSGRGHGTGTLDRVEGWFGPVEPGHVTASESEFVSSANSSLRTEGRGVNENEFESETEGWSETEVPVWVPIPVQELSSESEWSLEEKLSRLAELLKYQHQQHCYIQLNRIKTQPLSVPFVADRLLDPDNLLDYIQRINQYQGALRRSDADRLLLEREQKFLTESRERSADDSEVAAGVEIPLRRRRRT